MLVDSCTRKNHAADLTKRTWSQLAWPQSVSAVSLACAESTRGNSSYPSLSTCQQKPLSSDWLWVKSPSPLIGCGSKAPLLWCTDSFAPHIDSWFAVEGNRICDSWGRFAHLYLSICVWTRIFVGNYFTYIEHLFHKFTFRFAHIQILSTSSHCLLQVHKYVLHQIYKNWSRNVSVSVF